MCRCSFGDTMQATATLKKAAIPEPRMKLIILVLELSAMRPKSHEEKRL